MTIQAKAFSLITLIGLSGVCFASIHIQRDGPSYRVNSEPKSVSINLTPSEVSRLSKKALLASTPKAGFQGITTNLRPCNHFTSKAVNFKSIKRPMFVIGDNQASFSWLKKYLPRLEQLNAIGLVVQAKNLKAFSNIRAHTGDLILFPTTSSALVTRFGLSCYPVLISKTLIEH